MVKFNSRKKKKNNNIKANLSIWLTNKIKAQNLMMLNKSKTKVD
jgi:hypothetical protein